MRPVASAGEIRIFRRSLTSVRSRRRDTASPTRNRTRQLDSLLRSLDGG
jgi:hypothetical protein